MVTKPKLGYLEIVLEFDERYFRLAEDCIGSEVHFKFKVGHYVISLPNFEFSKQDAFGHPQPTANNTKIRLDWLSHKRIEGESYGNALSYNPKDKKILGFSCNRLIIRSRGPITSAQARKARDELPVWKNLFANWLEVLEYVDLEDRGIVIDQPDNRQAYFIPRDKPKTSRHIKFRKQTYNIAVNVQPGIEKVRLTQALRLASTGQNPPGYYNQIVRALKYFHTGDYRQCVLDAATAFEMAMTQLLDVKLKDLKDDQKKLIEDKYKGIVRLSDCLRKLGVAMPTQADIQAKIAEPRNLAIHKGKITSKLEAQDALNFVKDFVYASLPIR